MQKLLGFSVEIRDLEFRKDCRRSVDALFCKVPESPIDDHAKIFTPNECSEKPDGWLEFDSLTKCQVFADYVEDRKLRASTDPVAIIGHLPVSLKPNVRRCGFEPPISEQLRIRVHPRGATSIEEAVDIEASFPPLPLSGRMHVPCSLRVLRPAIGGSGRLKTG